MLQHAAGRRAVPNGETVLNHQLRLDESVRKLAVERKLDAERLKEYEQKDKAHNRRLLQANVWYLVKEHVASWALMKTLEQWNILESKKLAGEPIGECNCTIVERYGLSCYHNLERAYDEVIPLPLTLIHSRWWYPAGIEARSGWKPVYGVVTARLTGLTLTLERPSHYIVDTTNELLTFREALNQERQQRIDEAHAQATRAILHEALF